MKNDIYLGLGSNVGDKTKFLMEAIHLLGERLNILKTSRIYSSKPVGYTEQDIFLNMVLYCQADMDIKSLFNFVKEVEKKVGRVERFRWGPREIDIDILFFNDEVYSFDDLVVPHPRLHERDFVLIPLMDINPDLIHPVLKKSIRELLEELKDRYVL
ncbi:MAG: 2-amino-4-hydroxy-6-hydroxymethyldihydropteridine diphosphokinase [Hydrogenothermaceae bacterium]|nr:2-amino-4-hydroxy-6-hydroxymethyldihydropteridine diphosphokinase [Hydrogenothermaceae bacterium]